jgi:hypothetical protein
LFLLLICSLKQSSEERPVEFNFLKFQIFLASILKCCAPRRCGIGMRPVVRGTISLKRIDIPVTIRG